MIKVVVWEDYSEAEGVGSKDPSDNGAQVKETRDSNVSPLKKGCRQYYSLWGKDNKSAPLVGVL